MDEKKARCGDNTAITIKKKRVMAELSPISQPQLRKKKSYGGAILA